jgi:hypothetical protein
VDAVTGSRLAVILTGLGPPLVVGWQIAGLLIPVSKRTARSFRWSLGTAVGLGLAALGYLIWRVLGGTSAPHYLLGENAFLICLCFLLGLALKRSASDEHLADETVGAPAWLKAAVWFALAGNVGTFVARTSAEPHGSWDAWAIWNLKARFLFRGGTEWHRLFSPVLDWAHPDYPLLLPSTVARWWTYAGSEDPRWPALAALLALLALIGMMAGVLRMLHGPTPALLGILALTGTAGLVGRAASQYADLPLALYMTSSLACLVLFERVGGRGPLLLAGTCAGFAASTKNEGLLFLPVLAVAWLWSGKRWRAPRAAVTQLGWMAAGALPGIIAITLAKLLAAGDNDLLYGLGFDAITTRALDLARYGVIAKSLTIESLKLVMPAVLVAAWALTGFRCSTENRQGALLCLTTAGLMLVSYGVVYLLTPYDLAWHLSTSAARLLMGLWPMALLGMLLLYDSPRKEA